MFTALRNEVTGIKFTMIDQSDKIKSPLGILNLDCYSSIFSLLSIPKLIQITILNSQIKDFIHNSPLLWAHAELTGSMEYAIKLISNLKPEAIREITIRDIIPNVISKFSNGREVRTYLSDEIDPYMSKLFKEAINLRTLCLIESDRPFIIFGMVNQHRPIHI